MSYLSPCKEWQERLTTIHPEQSERAQIQAHLSQCQNCASAYKDYLSLSERIRALPSSELQPLPLAVGLKEQSAPVLLQTRSAKPHHLLTARPYIRAAVAAIVIGLLSLNALVIHAQTTQKQASVPQTQTAANTSQTGENSCFNMTLIDDKGNRTTTEHCPEKQSSTVDQKQSAQDFELTVKQVILNQDIVVVYEMTYKGSSDKTAWHPVIEATSPELAQSVKLERYILLQNADGTPDFMVAYGEYALKNEQTKSLPVTLNVSSVKNTITGEQVQFQTPLTFNFTVER